MTNATIANIKKQLIKVRVRSFYYFPALRQALT